MKIVGCFRKNGSINISDSRRCGVWGKRIVSKVCILNIEITIEGIDIVIITILIDIDDLYSVILTYQVGIVEESRLGV